MEAQITSASEVTQDGRQVVAFDVVVDGQVVLSHTLDGDVDLIKGNIKDFLRAYRAKYQSNKRVTVGEVITL
jgi:hypothetical protein